MAHGAWLVGGGDVYLLSNAEAKLELTPSTAGTYEYYCTLPGHTEVGMKGVLVVR